MARKAQAFESFEDGLVSFWGLDKERRPVRLLSPVRFQERVMGSVRYYNAELAGHRLERLVRIPQEAARSAPLDGCFAVIGEKQYRIARIQEISDTLPKCVDLSLEQNPTLLKFDETAPGSGGRY